MRIVGLQRPGTVLEMLWSLDLELNSDLVDWVDEKIRFKKKQVGG